MRFSKLSKKFIPKFKKHIPELLTGIGTTGMIVTTIMAVKATPKAIMIINEKEIELRVDKLSTKEKVKATWKCYVPATITGIASVACIIGASSVSLKRNAALATAYTLSEAALKEYSDKVVDIFGEKKEQSVRDAIAKDKIDSNPVSEQTIIRTNKGSTLCFDPWSSRYFYCDIEDMRKSANNVNYQMLNDGCASLNDFYYEIGLDDIKPGFDIGWRAIDGPFELKFSSQLTQNKEPCLVLDFTIQPKYNYEY